MIKQAAENIRNFLKEAQLAKLLLGSNWSKTPTPGHLVSGHNLENFSRMYGALAGGGLGGLASFATDTPNADDTGMTKALHYVKALGAAGLGSAVGSRALGALVHAHNKIMSGGAAAAGLSNLDPIMGKPWLSHSGEGINMADLERVSRLVGGVGGGIFGAAAGYNDVPGSPGATLGPLAGGLAGALLGSRAGGAFHAMQQGTLGGVGALLPVR